MFKKVFNFLLVIVLTSSMLMGCTQEVSSKNVSSKNKKPITIKVWHLHSEDNEESLPHQRMLKWAEEFNATNKSNITVEVSGAKTADVILTTISSGATPDIFMNYWNNAPTWADKGALLDLTDYVNNDKNFDKDDIFPAAWDRATYNGRIYSIPNSFASTQMYYRKDLLREAGYDTFPETMEEMIEAIDKLTIVDKNGTITRMGLIPDYPWLDNVLWPVAFGAKWIDENNKIIFDSDEMKAAYQWQLDIYNKYGYDNIKRFIDTLGTRGQVTDPLLTGHVAMRWNSEGIITALEEFGSDVEWGVAMIPYPAAYPQSKGSGMVTSNVFEINAKTKYPDQAWEVLSSLTSSDTLKMMAEGNYNKGGFFSRKSAVEHVRDNLDVSNVMKVVAEFMLSDNMDGFPMSAYINEYLGAIGDEMNKAFAGEQTIDEACENVVKRIQPLADKSPIK